ncbi:hypothetical protein KCU88_g3593, partial [Aureobasidium melanogenum]
MSSRKRPWSGTGSMNAQTPTRYAPSTPHAIRALQQRSGANKTRSARRPRALSDTVRPDSARGILRQLAKITAPLTRRTIPTPANEPGKENEIPQNAILEEKDNDHVKRPRLTLNIDDDSSIDDVEPPVLNEQGEEDDSELPVAPTPSILPDGDDGGPPIRGKDRDATITFDSIDFTREAREGASFIRDGRLSRVSGVTGDNEEPTILVEMGRRAISEEPTGRLSRYSFGSIRMSDFGSELEIRRESEVKTSRSQHDQSGYGLDYDDHDPLDVGGETEHLRNLGQPSPPLPPPDESTMNIPPLEESFQLDVSGEEAVSGNARVASAGTLLEGVSELKDPQHVLQESPSAASPGSEEPTGQDSMVDMDGATDEAVPPTLSRPRRKKLKMTRHGEMVPSLPTSLIKRVAIDASSRLGIRKPRLGREHMQALEQATEWFFEQVGDDLAAYSDHARRRKRVDRSDALMLMRRQRVLQGDGELRKAVRELLPEEAAAELEEMMSEDDE